MPTLIKSFNEWGILCNNETFHIGLKDQWIWFPMFRRKESRGRYSPSVKTEGFHVKYKDLYNAPTRGCGGVGMCLMLHMTNSAWFWNRTFKLIAVFLQQQLTFKRTYPQKCVLPHFFLSIRDLFNFLFSRSCIWNYCHPENTSLLSRTPKLISLYYVSDCSSFV